ncbi:MAG: hypothetical protein IJV82_02275 [Oscillospiraceae bacterium]|nr:hypothetical protein [Oscillospiraceae bacterium]
MTTKQSKKLLAVYKASAKDEEYCQLAKDHERLTKKFLEMLPTLTEEQQTALSDYWAVVHAMHQRLLELACARKRRFPFRRRL